MPDAAMTPIVLAEPQPYVPLWVIAYTSDTSPAVTSTAPSASNDFMDVSRLSCRRRGARKNAATPTGTLTKKIQDQLSTSVRTPPSRTPAAAPKPPTAPQTPSATLRSRPSEKVVVRMDSAAGEMIAAPSPWSERAAIKDPSDQARPASSEARVKTTMPTRNSRRRPSRSAARPPRSRKPPKNRAYALITHWRFSWENPRSILIEGNATFTIAMSRTTMNWTALRSASASHFLRSVATMRAQSFRLRSEARLQTTTDSLLFTSETFTTASSPAMIERMAKHYDQYCPVAHALDVVGDRWALLVVRELTKGPKRYTDLAEGLPGIGTNILAARLRDLEAAGVVTKKTLPPPAASRVYALTDYGLALKPVMRELALWGARSLGPPSAEDELFPGWLVCPVDMILGPIAPAGRFEFRVGDEIASLVDGVAYTGPIDDPDVVVEGDAEGLYYLFIERRLDGVSISGDRALLDHLIDAAPQPIVALSFYPRAANSSSSRSTSSGEL